MLLCQSFVVDGDCGCMAVERETHRAEQTVAAAAAAAVAAVMMVLTPAPSVSVCVSGVRSELSFATDSDSRRMGVNTLHQSKEESDCCTSSAS